MLAVATNIQGKNITPDSTKGEIRVLDLYWRTGVLYHLKSWSKSINNYLRRSDGGVARVSTSAEKPNCGTYRASPHQTPKLPPDPPGK